MNTKIPTMQTASLTLRPLQASDAPTLHRIYQTDGVLLYFPSTTPLPLEKVDIFNREFSDFFLRY